MSLQEFSDIHDMLLKIRLPIDEQELFPYEIPIMIDFLKLFRTIEKKMDALNATNDVCS